MSGQNRIKVLVLFIVALIFPQGLRASAPDVGPELINSVHYQTNFLNCPTRNVGVLTLDLWNTFKKEGTLLKLKERILKENLVKKHFLSSYRITFNPLSKLLKFNFQCPLPLMKVQIYKEVSQEYYDAILVENGELYDPTYEVLVAAEKRKELNLPFLALPYKVTTAMVQRQLADLYKKMSPHFRKKISEIILGADQKLTIILSLNGLPSSSFLGEADWKIKTEKLQKIIAYMESKKKVPSIINLTNSKKVVVKFSDNF